MVVWLVDLWCQGGLILTPAQGFLSALLPLVPPDAERGSFSGSEKDVSVSVVFPPKLP